MKLTRRYSFVNPRQQAILNQIAPIIKILFVWHKQEAARQDMRTQNLPMAELVAQIRDLSGGEQ